MVSNLEMELARMERARKQQALGVSPYRGTKPYIFVSYAHRDFDEVIPTIKALIDHGFRVWYDEGIDPGTEWDANIAAHIRSCSCMISFLSKNYLASSNCLDELRYARNKETPQMLIYLEEVNLPGELELRFGCLQAIHQYKHPNAETFYEELFSAVVLAPTLQASAPKKAVPIVESSEVEPSKTNSVAPAVKKDIASNKRQPAKTKPRSSRRKITIAALLFVAILIPLAIMCIMHRSEGKSSTGLELTLNTDQASYTVSGIGTCADTDIVIPDTYDGLPVTDIGSGAFLFCESLSSITIPDCVTTIGDMAFYSCDSLANITIPDSVTSIGEDAFGCCTNLTSASVGKNVISIGEGAFSSCYSLEEITVGEGNIAYCSENGILYSKDMTVLVCYPAGKEGTVFAVPDRVITIENCAFQGSDLVSIMLPHSVTSIGKSAFDHNSELTEITVDEGNTAYSCENGILYSKDMATLVCYPAGKEETAFAVPDCVTTIGDRAFYSSGLSSITIPSTVVSIGDHAFAFCDNLTTIIIPDGVVSISDYAFSHCDNLATIIIPDSVLHIAANAFNDCDHLTICGQKGSYAEQYARENSIPFQAL